jgi:hypothetical protein
MTPLKHLFSLLAPAAFAGAACAAQPAPSPAIRIHGDVSVNSNSDGGLRPAVGVQNIQVFRANRTRTTHADGLADTYLHAPMLAWWHGRFHLEYLSGPRSEHETPCPTSLTTSADGVHWDEPRIVFPSFRLPDGRWTITHQRMGFYVAPGDRLLALAFHGLEPSPNDGTGIGRVVREITRDGSFGPIHIIRYNRHAGWNESNTPYPPYTASSDSGFVAACDALLADKLATAQWWEEDRSEDGFYRLPGKAINTYHRADGTVVAIAKDAQHAISTDRGESWTRLGFAQRLPVNSAKYWVQKTGDDRWAMLLNPTSRLRHPLAIMTSADGEDFSDMLVVHGELPVQRFPGFYKNMGPQYVRGIAEGNGTPPDGALWVTYSVNKEDIWVSRIPVPITGAAPDPAALQDFESTPLGGMPEGWNIYRPRWAPVQVVAAEGATGHALELRDEDPCDHAAATRVFPAARSVVVRFKLFARTTDGRFEVDVVSARGERAVQIAFDENGRIEARHEGIWKPAGTYEAGRWTDIEIDVNPGPGSDRFQFRVDGRETLRRTAYMSELVPSVERVVFRTGPYRQRGDGGHEIPGADEKSPLRAYLIDDVSIQLRP